MSGVMGRKAVHLAVGFALALCELLGPATGSAAGSGVISVGEAQSLCRAHPAARQTMTVRGWFIPAYLSGEYTQGGLFESRHTVPITTVDQWDADGHWKKYGALLTHLRTGASVPAQMVTLHGGLHCDTYRFWTDRDPFRPPPLQVTYGRTGTVGSGAITTWASAGGLRLTLTVPRQSYPRNALARVTVSLENVSQHDVGYEVPGYSAPGFVSPQAEVMDGSGRIVFPPAMPYLAPIPGPGPGLVPLHPRKAVRLVEYVVVRGLRIRASQFFTPTWAPNERQEQSVLRTQPVALRLTAEPSPRIVMRIVNGQPVADVTRPAGVKHRMLRLNFGFCGIVGDTPGYSHLSYNASNGWVPSGLQMRPGCSPVMQWHVRVGWLDHPVAALDYTAPEPVRTTTPTPQPTITPTPPSAASPRFVTVLRRAARAMAGVHSLHMSGTRRSVSRRLQTHMQVQADCSSRSGAGVPVLLRTLVSGTQSKQGPIDEGYVLDGPVLRATSRPLLAWHRSRKSGGRWQSVDLRTLWGRERYVPSQGWSPDPAYLNQVCPDLLRETYLAAPLPGARIISSDLTTLDGRRVWRLEETEWFTIDLSIDAQTFRLRRLVLHDRSGPTSRWTMQFDYSQSNARVTVPLPPRRRDGR